MHKQKTKDLDGQQKLPGLLVADWQKIFDAMDIGITISDKNGCFEIFNSKMQAITGYTLEEVNACGDFSRLIYPDPLERQEALERLNEIMQKPGCREIETQIQAKDGTKKILSVSTFLINYKDQVMFLSIFQDVIQRRKDEQTLKQVKDELEIQTWGQQKTNVGIRVLYKELETKIREVEKLNQVKSDFISTVSHELRTPLAITKEGMGLVLDKVAGEINEKQEKILSTARSNIDRLARIIDELLNVSKIEAGKVNLKRELVDIVGLIRQAASTFELNLKEKNLELKINVPEKQIDAFVDPDKMIQIFTNLVKNAIKFTEKGSIEISVKELEGNIECAVSDTGIGISQDNLPKVFDKFQQFGRVAGAGEKGTGLGLSIVKSLVVMHKGDIRVESQLGKGTKFTFTLPKYGPKEVLYENIEERIAQAQKKQIGFSVLLIRLDNYSEIEKVLGKGGLKKDILKIFEIVENTIRIGDFAIVIDETVIIILVGADSRDALEINTRLKRAIKETIFEIDEELKVNFSYGYSVYPNDGGRPEDLLAKAQKSLVSESEERLTKNIMVVDDEPVVTEALKKLLEKVGYSNFIEVYDGEQALQKIKNKAPDLLILDMKMPNMSGYEVIGRLKENIETKDIPILIVSAHEVEIDKLKEYTKKKAIPVLGKPIDMGQLEKLVNYLL